MAAPTYCTLFASARAHRSISLRVSGGAWIEVYWYYILGLNARREENFGHLALVAWDSSTQVSGYLCTICSLQTPLLHVIAVELYFCLVRVIFLSCTRLCFT